MTRTNLEYLVQPIGGLISSVRGLTNHPGEPRFPVMTASLGDISQLSDEPTSEPGRPRDGAIDGAGSGLEEGQARVGAIAEALERYSSCVHDSTQFIWATARELADEALDLDIIPRCSDREIAHPRCLLVAPDKDSPMRWVRGVSLSTGNLVWVPAVMVYLYMPPQSRGERIWLPISTGCAAHISIERALIGAICEVIERDAISLTWLQQMALPQIELDEIPDWLQPYLDRNRSNGDIKHIFFDATTDLGVPTVYSLQVSPHNDVLAALVMCSTELDPAVAIAKVIRESASSRLAMQVPQQLPDSFDDFFAVSHGAAFMGRGERLPAFDFLIQSARRRRLSNMPRLVTGHPDGDLTYLLDRLRLRGMEAIAVDLTTDEARRAGFRVVRVIIPSLQPLSFHYRSRFLAHPRLYDAPRVMGFPVHAEADINPWPQPFA